MFQVRGKTSQSGVILVGLLLTVCSCSHQSRLPSTQAERDSLEHIMAAVATIDSLKILEQQFANDNYIQGQIVALRYQGKLLREENNFNEAIDCHLKGLELAQQCNDTLEIVKAYNNLGTNYRRLGILEEAAQYHLQAKTLCMQHSDTSRVAQKNYVTALNGVGNIYLTLGNLKQADSVFQIALKGEKQLGSALGQAINLANIGAIKEELGQTDSAWHYYRQSLQKNVEANSALGIGLCHGHFGELYEKAKKYPQAIDEYQQALDVMKNSPDYYHQLEIGLSIARIYIVLGKMSEAKDLLDEAKTMTEYNYSMEQRARLHMLYYKYYERLGDARKALDNYIKSKELSDSVVDIDKVNHIQDMRLSIERARQQAELQQANMYAKLAHRTRNIIIVAFSAATLSLLIVIALLYYALRTRIKTQRVTQQLQQARDSFFTNITHEFRTPLTVILGLGHQMEHAKADQIQEVQSAAKMIVRQGNSLLGLINQLLDISKVRSAIGQPHWRHGNIIAFIQMVAENYQSHAKSKHIELSYTHSLTNIGMDFVPDYMQKIEANLLSNAIKYTPPFGKVNITAEQVQNNLRLKVFDTGKGIDPKTLPHIFEAFFQGENSNENIGTGVGLSLVKLMVEAMNGEVKVESIEGQGSTFVVTLPLKHGNENYMEITQFDDVEQALPIADEDGPAPESTNPTHSLSSSLANTHILIVEDNNDIAQYIGMHLEDKCHITYASGGEEGFEKAQEIMPDLIITDLMMPGSIDGLEFCRKIRKSDVLSHIPIIIITAKTTDADRIKGLEAGADAYLVKPFNSEELIVRVNKLLEQRRMLRKKFSTDMVISNSTPSSNVSQQSRDFLNKFVDVVYTNMATGKLDVETIADRMAMSRTQLNRKMLAITGENTSTYIMQLRMSKAKRLLRGDINLPIGSVAQQCGFDDVAYFSRIFKQQCDLTPSQYRKSIE